MEKAIGPTISVSQSTIYITGTSEDNLSGTAIYRYDPPNDQGEVKNVDNISTEKFTAPQFELTTSGIWTFYAQDTAGNSDTKQTSSITLYRCNYCNQKTVQKHYRCPTHYTSQSCSFTSTTCTVSSGVCGAEFNVVNSYYYSSAPDVTCYICERNLLYAATWSCGTQCPDCGVWSTYYWCYYHTNTIRVKCNTSLQCGNQKRSDCTRL